MPVSLEQWRASVGSINRSRSRIVQSGISRLIRATNKVSGTQQCTSNASQQICSTQTTSEVLEEQTSAKKCASCGNGPKQPGSTVGSKLKVKKGISNKNAKGNYEIQSKIRVTSEQKGALEILIPTQAVSKTVCRNRICAAMGMGSDTQLMMFILRVVSQLLLKSGNVERNPGPVTGRLSTKHLAEVRRLIWDARTKWMDLGLELGIDITRLEVIKTNNKGDTDSCFREMLSFWLQQNDPHPTWAALVAALRQPTVGFAGMAETVELKHVDPDEEENDCIPSADTCDRAPLLQIVDQPLNTGIEDSASHSSQIASDSNLIGQHPQVTEQSQTILSLQDQAIIPLPASLVHHHPLHTSSILVGQQSQPIYSVQAHQQPVQGIIPLPASMEVRPLVSATSLTLVGQQSQIAPPIHSLQDQQVQAPIEHHPPHNVSTATSRRLNEVLERNGLQESQLNIECSVDCRNKVAMKISDWQSAATTEFKIPDEDIESIDHDCHTLKEKQLAFLRRWAELNGSQATYLSLARILDGLGHLDIIEMTLLVAVKAHLGLSANHQCVQQGVSESACVSTNIIGQHSSPSQHGHLFQDQWIQTGQNSVPLSAQVASNSNVIRQQSQAAAQSQPTKDQQLQPVQDLPASIMKHHPLHLDRVSDQQLQAAAQLQHVHILSIHDHHQPVQGISPLHTSMEHHPLSQSTTSSNIAAQQSTPIHLYYQRQQPAMNLMGPVPRHSGTSSEFVAERQSAQPYLLQAQPFQDSVASVNKPVLRSATLLDPANSTVPQKNLVKQQVTKLEKQFGNLVTKSLMIIKQKRIVADDFCTSFTCLNVSMQYEHKELLQFFVQLEDRTANLRNIWAKLNTYWNFLNYELLEHVVNIFADSLKEDMQTFVADLKVFRETTRVCDFTQCWPVRGQCPPEDKLKKLVVKKVDKSWDECTLQDIEDFKETLTHKFFIPGFSLFLEEITNGSLIIKWSVPEPVAMKLKEDIKNVDESFFKANGIKSATIIESVTNDDQECLSPMKMYAAYLKDIYSSKMKKKISPFKLARLFKKKLYISDADNFTKQSIRGDVDDIMYVKWHVDIAEVGKPNYNQHTQRNEFLNLILIEGAPGIGKTTFSWQFCRKWAMGEVLQEYSLLVLLPLRDNRVKSAKTLSDLFYHSTLNKAVVQELESSQGQGVAIWLEAWDELDAHHKTETSIFLELVQGLLLPKATVFVTSRPWATEFIREDHAHRLSQHIEVLSSSQQQIDRIMKEGRVKSTKFHDYILSNPSIKAAMYTPVTADIVVEVYEWNQETNTPPPTTMAQLYTAFTCKLLMKYLSQHPVFGPQQLKICSFYDLPTDILQQGLSLCQLAYKGIMSQQIVFNDLPSDFDSLGLMQSQSQLYVEGDSSPSYHFIHLTLQEFLAAIHISRMYIPVGEQAQLIQRYKSNGHYKMTLRFLAGVTSLNYLTPHITSILLNGVKDIFPVDGLTLFHWLFEAGKFYDTTTTRTPGSGEMEVVSHYNWTPLDYYVVGHCLVNSNCIWDLSFGYVSCDDESLEMLCRGLISTECRHTGYISKFKLSYGTISSTGMRWFTQIPKRLIEHIQTLDLGGCKTQITEVAMELLSVTVKEMNSLKTLVLQGTNIGGRGGSMLIQALSSCKALNKLDLGSTDIGEEEYESLSELLEHSECLEELNISYNELSTDSVASIMRGLHSNSSLRFLDMRHSPFSFEKTSSLTSVLQDTSCNLKVLIIEFCSITSEGAIKLATALTTNTSLETLWLNGNNIGDDGACALAKSFEMNISLRNVYLQSIGIGNEGLFALAKLLQSNQSLKELDLADNCIGAEGACALAKSLQSNQSLNELFLYYNSIGDEGACALAEMLSINKSLQLLDLRSCPDIGVHGNNALVKMSEKNKSRLSLTN